jgi:hypothetical protein
MAAATVMHTPAQKPARPEPCQPRESPDAFTAGTRPISLPPEPETQKSLPETNSSEEGSSSSAPLTSRLQYSVLNHSGQPIYCAVKWAGPGQSWSDWFTVDQEWTELSTRHSAAFECGPPVAHVQYPIIGGTKYYVVPSTDGDWLDITEIVPTR